MVATRSDLIRRTPDGVHFEPDAPGDGDGSGHERIIEQWARIGGVCGVVAMVVYSIGSAAELTTAQAAIVACVFGPAIVCASMGLYHVLRFRRRTVSLDLGVVANAAAGLTVTLMLMAQLGLKGWFELQFGDGATESSDRALHAAFEAANGIQLGLDVAWDVFLVLGTVLLAVNMWRHPRFGRVIASTGIAIAVALITINLAVFPEPPGHADLIDLGPLIGLWYVLVSIRLLGSGRWVRAHAEGRDSHRSRTA